MNLESAVAFAAVFAVLWASHAIGDHWVQRHTDAQHKGLPGGEGRRACARHVATYLATAVVGLGLAWLYTDLRLDLAATAAGLAVSGISHYLADRREPLRRIADAFGKGEFYRLNSGGLSGSYLLDQAWHTGFIAWAALIAAGGTERLGLTAVLAVLVTAAVGFKVLRFERRARIAGRLAPISPAVTVGEPISKHLEAH